MVWLQTNCPLLLLQYVYCDATGNYGHGVSVHNMITASFPLCRGTYVHGVSVYNMITTFHIEK